MVNGDGELPGGGLGQAYVAVGAGLDRQPGILLAGGATSRRATGRQLGVGRIEAPGLGRRDLGAPPRSSSAAAATASGPSRRSRRWWSLNAAPCARQGSAGLNVTRPTTVSASSIGRRAQAEHPGGSSAVSMSSSAEATIKLASADRPAPGG